jgi:hypothetical protein
MDNLAPHKAAVVHEAIRAAGLEPRLRAALTKCATETAAG